MPGPAPVPTPAAAGTTTIAIANAVADFTVLEDASNTTIDYSNVFTDVDNDDNDITKAVQSNSNTDLVAASISGNTLTLDYVADQNGTATINCPYDPCDQTLVVDDL